MCVCVCVWVRARACLLSEIKLKYQRRVSWKPLQVDLVGKGLPRHHGEQLAGSNGRVKSGISFELPC